MHSAIVVINMPERNEMEGHHPKWLALLADINRAFAPIACSLDAQQGVTRLAENVWQVNFYDNPGAFARLIECAKHHKLSYGILQLKDVPVWTRHPSNRNRDQSVQAEIIPMVASFKPNSRSYAPAKS
jgi:hypothetical protein